MTMERLAPVTRTAGLELKYNDNLHQIDLTVKDEEARRLQLQIQLLQDENNDLHEQLATEDDRIDELEKEREETNTHMIEAEENAHRLETELRMSDRAVNNLRAELEAMNGLSTDSTKLLTEKLALSRELANLRPELEHLRTQADHHQTVIAEKLSLQRLVSSLEVELETEKRALATRTAQNMDESGREEELRAKIAALGKELRKERREKELAQGRAEKESTEALEQLQKDLDTEKAETQRLAKSLETGTQEWDIRKTALESKLDQMRTKLRSTKEQLKETRAELAQLQAAPKAVATTNDNDTQAKDIRKRKAVQMDLDATIGTPDGVAVRGRRQVAKKGRLEQSIVGEKSMFSITPFLNRTTSIAPETPGANRDDAEEMAADIQAVDDASDRVAIPSLEENEMSTPSASMKQRSKKTSKSNEVAEDKVLGESKIGKMNVKQPLLKKKSKLSNALARVSEEDDENEEPASVAVKSLEQMTKPDLATAKITAEVGERKKKRKLLGAAKTLFDEEDAEVTKRPAKFKPTATKGLSRGGLAGPKGGLRGGLAGELGAFGGFSPLKKDKRGAQASFLA